MPLSTTAKVMIGVAVGTATLGGGIAIARARSKKSDPKMKRDDGTRPADGDRKVVQLDFDALYDSSEDDGYPIDVGTRYEIAFPKDAAAEFTAGRRIGSVSIAKMVGGEKALDKAWAVDTDSFESRHNDLSVGFDLGTKTLSVTADRAGLYVVALVDREGVTVIEDMLFYATSQSSGSDTVDAGTKRFKDLFELYGTATADGLYPLDVGTLYEIPNMMPMRLARQVKVSKLLETGPLPPETWAVQGGKLPSGFAVGTDFAVEYVAAGDMLRLKVNRAGRYRLDVLGGAGETIFSGQFTTAV